MYDMGTGEVVVTPATKYYTYRPASYPMVTAIYGVTWKLCTGSTVTVSSLLPKVTLVYTGSTVAAS